MKTHIDTAPEAIRRKANKLRHDNRSMARGYLAYLDYCKSTHFVPEPPQAVFGIVAERLKASGDTECFRLFCINQADELRAEQESSERYAVLTSSGWINGPDHAAVVAKNRAAYEAEQVGQAIAARSEQLLRERDLSARAQAAADARKELTR